MGRGLASSAIWSCPKPKWVKVEHLSAFNPERQAWLPVLHTHRDAAGGPWHFTALYSNTARAHGLGKTHDWVVLYFYDDHHREEQHTVVTESRGPLAGRRVVRGREAECRAWYARHEPTAA